MKLPRKSLSIVGPIGARHIGKLSLGTATSIALLSGTLHAAVLEEVIITAQKREQSLLDVGMSVNAFGGKQLADAGITKPSELNGAVPSLVIKENIPGTAPIFTIRGVGLNNFAANNNPTVGVYSDEVFLTSTSMMSFSLYDIERVEVLKGPQGTLYGRNTTGGAIGFFTNRPGEEFSADIRATAANYDRYEAEGSINIPLNDDWAVRFAGLLIDQNEGVWEDRQGQDLGDQDIKSGRVHIGYNPADSGFTANLKLEYTDVNSEAGQFELFGTQDPTTFGLCAPVLADRRDNSQCSDFFGNQNDDGKPFVGDWDPDPFESEQTSATLTLSAEIGDMQLDSITSFQGLERFLGTDVDGTLQRQADFVLDDDIEQFSQELRLSGEINESGNWILGAFYSEDTVESLVFGDFSDFAAVVTGGALTNQRTAAFADQDTTSYALFVHTDWDLSDHFSATVAARYTDEEKEFEGGNTDISIVEGTGGGLFGPGDPDCPQPFQLSCNKSADKIDDTNVSWRLSLDYEPTDDLLAYVSISQGYKSGGFDGGFTTTSDSLIPFDREDLLAYELGFKANLLDGSMRATGALFYYDYTDVQTQVQVDVGQLSVIKLGNIEEAEVTGVELEFQWLPTDALDIAAGISWIDTELGTFNSPVGPVAAGNELPNAPELTFTTQVRYEVSLGEHAMAFQVNARFNDDVFRESLNQNLLASDASWNFDGIVSLYPASQQWNVSLWGKNLTDEDEPQQAGNNGIGMGHILTQMPRTYGLTVAYSFD